MLIFNDIFENFIINPTYKLGKCQVFYVHGYYIFIFT